MLKVLFGKQFDDTITSISTYFNNMYETDWFLDKDVIQMVKDLDKSELKGLCVVSPALGSISVERLSGGVKGLILMLKEDNFISDLISYGNNCEDWILKIASKKDITVCMTGFDMTFEGKDVTALCLNDNSLITNYREWCLKMVEFGETYYEG